MKWLYFILIAVTLLCPIVLSFESKVQYRKSWKNSLLAALIISVPFIVWDIVFTQQGFWGFNPAYISGVYLFGLPLEELLFFIIVPFACTFIYECCRYFFRAYQFNVFNRVFTFLIPVYGILLVTLGDIGYYTLSSIIASGIVLFWMVNNPQYRHIAISFCFALIPFFIMNGILTGAVTDEPIVWYNETEKVSQRLFTIPMEDVLYNFALLASNILLFEKLNARFAR